MPLDKTTQKVLVDLRRKRDFIKASLTRIVTIIHRFNPREQAISLLNFRQEELPRINHKFDAIQSEIERLTTDDIEGAQRERETFEADYY